MTEGFSPVQKWILAARPKTLYAAVTPVIVGTATAWQEGVFRIWPAIVALICAVLIQIGTNLANDVYDFQRGADTSQRLGPVRVTQSGMLSQRQVIAGMWLSFGLASILGIGIALDVGWPVILIGVFSILAGLAYTGGPIPFGYRGLGDIFVFVFFGLIAVTGTYYVQAKMISAGAIWASIPVGLLATAILVVNNLRDIRTDQEVGKITLAVRLGERGTKIEFLALMIATYLIPILIWRFRIAHPWVLITWITLPMAVSLTRKVFTLNGPALNLALAATGQLEIAFGVLYSLGLIIST